MHEPPIPSAVIYDQGYRPYRGRYLGRPHALATLAWSEFLRAWGWHRSWKYKATIGIASVVVLAQTILLFAFDTATAPFGANAPRSLLNPHSALFDGLGLVLLFMSALVAPDLLCNDRRYGVLALYRARPFEMQDYLLAKGLALFAVLGTIILVPQLALFSGKVFLSPTPTQYIADHGGEILTILVAALIYASYYSAYSLGIASLTSSRAFASASTIGIMVLSGIVSVLVFQATQNRYLLLLGDLDNAPSSLKNALFGLSQAHSVPLFHGESMLIEPLSPWIYLLAIIAIAGAAMLLIRRVYASEKL